MAHPSEPAARARWRGRYDSEGGGTPVRNRSGIPIEPLYDAAEGDDRLGYPGEYPFTRGIHSTMHRGRPWSRRLIVGLGLPEDYNARMRAMVEGGASGLYVAPCNSHMRGFDADQVPPVLLGTCGTVVNTTDDLAQCLDGLPIERLSLSLGDTAPFTLSAMTLAVADRRSVPRSRLAGTTNQSDYLSHYAALHMFFRLSLPGARRMLMDHVAFMMHEVPRWNPVSVVGQHMQEAGATPAEAMAFTLSSALQHARDLIARGHEADDFLPRFSFFFDVSMSFFEEIAKFRAGRRLWARLARERFGARDARSWRMRFHAQTAGVDLTRQAPYNNIARVTVQAMAGIFGGLQSLHTDAYDEAIASPSARSARIALDTQNILRAEAELDKVIDPLGGSYYVETLTDEMEHAILEVMARVEDAGGMYEAVRTGLVQRMIGDSALDYQNAVESGAREIVGVNTGRAPEDEAATGEPPRLASEARDRFLDRLARFKRERSQARVDDALDALAQALDDGREGTDNAYARVVEAAVAGATHGEICARARAVVGPGQPLIMA